MAHSPIPQLKGQRLFFETGKTLDVDYRIDQLLKLERLVHRYQSEALAVLKADLQKPNEEAYLTEILPFFSEVRRLRKHLKSWQRPKRLGLPFWALPGSARIVNRPYGQVLIYSPWNYPIYLSLMPLIGALAAGNVVALKPSEFAPQTAQFLFRLLTDNFDSGLFVTALGNHELAGALLDEHRFDYIFFTGSKAVGQQVMTKAAKHLTPLSLELGGKCPALVAPDANLEISARRLVWGKFTNAGQTCVAPDYVLVPNSLKPQFTRLLVRAIESFYGSNSLEAGDYGRIVNLNHHERLCRFLSGAKILFGGQTDPKKLFVAPTLVDADWRSPLMQDEIFGPILPLIGYDDIFSALEKIRALPSPLCVYLFTNDAQLESSVRQKLNCGGGCTNDTLVQMAIPHFPFGGVGESGFGRYHGRHSFETFSRPQAWLSRSAKLDPSLRYPPFTANKLKWLVRLLR